MKLMSRLLVVLTALVLATTLVAQEKKPLSPPAKAEGTIGAAKITVDYSAPSMRNRTIMGGLVPWDKVWRTGANAATTMTTDTDLRIGELSVPKGTYTLYTIPGQKQWTLIVNKQTGQWGTKYDESQDLGRVPMTVRALSTPVETFVISIDSKDAKSGALKLTWEKTEASVPVTVAK